MIPSLAKLSLRQDATGPPARKTRSRAKQARGDAAPYAPPLTKLPDDMLASIVHQLTSEDDVRTICGSVRAFCIANRGLCDEAAWQEACAALGLTPSNLAAAFPGGTTWAVAFATLCNQMRYLYDGVRRAWLNMVRAGKGGEWPKRAATMLVRQMTDDTPTLKRMLVAAGAPDKTKEELWNMDNALRGACYACRADQVERLLNAGADPNQPTDDDTMLMEAVWHCNGDVTIVQMLIDAGVNVNYMRERTSWTALKTASEKGYAAVVKALLAAGADVNKWGGPGSEGYDYTPLMLASKEGHLAVVKILLDAGADINKANITGNTALGMTEAQGHDNIVAFLRARGAKLSFIDAAKLGNLARVVELIDAGADANQDQNGTTALMVASKQGHTAVVERLLAAGADVNYKGGLMYRKPALKLASEQGHAAVVAALLRAGADANRDSEILMEASENGHADIVKMLIAAGANVNYVDGGGETALTHASGEGHLAIVHMLITAGAEINAQLTGGGQFKGYTALGLASRMSHYDVVSALLAAGADANIVDDEGKTALLEASQQGDFAMVKLLLSAGANIDHADKDGYTALMLASWNGHVAIVKMLLAAGANVNQVDNDGYTALMLASLDGHVAVVAALLAAGANVNHAANRGRTALMEASGEGHAAIVKILLTAGANVNMVDNHNSTALGLAAEHGHVDVVRALLDVADIHVNRADNDGDTALRMAERKGHAEIAALLRARGAT
jgi:serine/threonine-protein phosphatase 6 regulatory ankyrin repeat subunit B